MSDPAPPTRSPFRRQAGLAALGAGLLGLLTLVALAARGSQPAGESGAGGGPSGAFWDGVISAMLALMVVTVMLLVWGFWANRHAAPLQDARRRSNRRFLALALIIVLLGFAASRLRELVPAGREATGTPPGEVERPPGAEGEEATQRRAEFRPLPAAIAFLVAVGALAAVVGLGGMPRKPLRDLLTEEELLEELDAVLAETLADLRAEPDPRVAVIAAYARTERVLARYGLPREESEAPLEYERRVEPELRAGSAGAHRLLATLTRLYERAKFSDHAIDRRMKDDAIAALESLRAELARELTPERAA